MNETIILALKLHIKNKVEMSVKNQKTILKYINKQNKELERLNNIINELDTFLKNKIENFDKDVKDTILHEQMTIRVIYDYLQELKGDSSNE